MTDFFKERYSVHDLIKALETLPQDYIVETCHTDFEKHWGVINDIDVLEEDKRIVVWFE